MIKFKLMNTIPKKMDIKNYGEKSLIKIINAVVNGKELPKFEDYTAIFQAAKRHSLGNFFYFAIIFVSFYLFRSFIFAIFMEN